MPGSIGHLVGRTVADVRDVMIQGDSGILATSAPSFTPEYKPSLRSLIWPNGSHALTFSSEEPSQLRGPQSHWTWVDEMAALNHRPDDSGATAWDHVRIGTRLGHHPQVFATTTPKRIVAIRELVRLARTTVHRVSSTARRRWPTGPTCPPSTCGTCGCCTPAPPSNARSCTANCSTSSRPPCGNRRTSGGPMKRFWPVTRSL